MPYGQYTQQEVNPNPNQVDKICTYLRATAHAADPSNSEEEVKEEAMHGWV